jgi:MSHA biogenesis protein MshQ
VAATLVTSALWSATWPAPSATANSTIKAGANFSLGASTDAGASYIGSLKLDASKLTAQVTSQDATQQSGGAVGALTPSALTSNGGAVNATYSEAGYLYLEPGAYRDDTFPASDIANGDCLIASQSNTLSNGKYGCNIGNQDGLSLGRFIPDHFSVTGFAITNRSDLPACFASTFTYMGEPMTATFTLTAQNAANGTTQNYQGLFAKFNPATPMVAETSGVFNLGAVDGTLPRTPFGACGAVPAHPCITPGTASGAFVNGAAAITLPMTVYRGAAAVGPFPAFSVGVAPVDAEGVALGLLDMDTANPAAATNNRGRIGSTMMRHGRINIDNAYGSEALSLNVTMTAQYWSGQTFATNDLDNCTPLPASSFSMSAWQGGINATNMGASHFIGSGAIGTGMGAIVLLKPGPPSVLGIKGSVMLNSLIPYLPGSGRETFGASKSSPVIYIREVY